MADTKLLYLTDAYLKTIEAKITNIITTGHTTSITLDQTIFYPQGGGQPADTGTITGSNGTLAVAHVSYNNSNPTHQGKLTGTLNQGDMVNLNLDWDRRFHHMRNHTAGHILHEAVLELLPECPSVSGTHGISNQSFVKFKGIIDQTQLQEIEDICNQIVEADEPITTKFMTKAQILKAKIYIPFKLPSNKPLRIMQVGSRPPIPDGGTHVASTADVLPFKLTGVEYDDGHSIIHYQISATSPSTTSNSPANPITTPTLTPPSTKKKAAKIQINHSLSDLETKITTLKSALDTDLKSLSPDNINSKYLGKKGAVDDLTKLIPALPASDRGTAGKLINLLKADIQKTLVTTQPTLPSPPSDWLDVTVPGTLPQLGHLHPVSGAMAEITSIFAHIGFTRARYPEVDWDHYAFESLNMPQNHPARDEWETFFIDQPENKQMGKLVLTPHTSNGQVREMERVGEPPIRMLNIARCYRRQQDVTHTAMFHQFEGLVVDEDINIQHLKGTLDYFAQKFYGPGAKSRIRPFMFKFTEPSFEVDFSCVHCNGKGCRFCKSGWHEVGGAGMVHPNVLKAGGIDPDKYTGFAFGWGIERVYTLRPGLKLDDIRPLYQNNLDFLSQF